MKTTNSKISSKTAATMKKIFNFLMSVAVAATTFVGCNDANVEVTDTPTITPAPTAGVYRQLTFADGTDNARTHHDGETVVWSKGDRIRIGYTKGGIWQNAEGRTSAEEGTAKLYASTEQHEDAEFSVFRVTQLFKETEGEGTHIFYGLYPSEITRRNEPDFSDSKNGKINVEIPQIQTPSASTFDKRADLLVSRSLNDYEAFPTYEEQISMRWKRLVAHGVVTLKKLREAGMEEDETIRYVEFIADEDDALTGEFSLDIAGQSLTANKTAKNKVRLSYTESDYNALDSEGYFVVWFATNEFTATNLTVKVGTDKAIYTKTFSNANRTFVANKRNTINIGMSGANRTPVETGEAWKLLTDASILSAGKKVVIAAADFDVAMSTTQNSNNRGQANIKKNDDNTIEIEDDTQVFILREGTDDGSWAFEAQGGYIYAASTSSNHLKTKAALDATGSFTIEVTTAGIATVVSVGRTSEQPGIIRYNDSSTGKLFSCYKPGNAMKDIAIYYNAAALETLATPVIDSKATVLPEEGNSAQITWGAVENALYYTVTCKCAGQENVVFNNITDTTYLIDNLAAGEWNITVTAYADGFSPATSAHITVEISDPTPSVAAEPTKLMFTAAGGTKTVAITTKNLTSPVIAATSDNDIINNWLTLSGSTLTVTAPANNGQTPISGTITITATAGETIVSTTVDVQQTAKSVATTEWQLLTDISSLQAEGLEVVIAAAGYDVAMGAQNESNRASAEITKSENTMSIVGDVTIFQLQQSGEGWTLFDENENGYLYAPSNTANQLKTREKLGDDGNALWAIDIADGVTSIVAQGESSHKVMQYNSAVNSLLFSCYETASQKPVAIYYRLASHEPRILSLEVTKNEIGYAADSKIEVTVTTKYAAGETLNIAITNSNGETISSTTATIDEDDVTEFTVTANQANETSEPRELTLTASLNNGSTKSTTIAQAAKPTDGANATDYIDREFTGVTSTSTYSEWSDKEGASGAVYAGNSCGGNNSVQLRTTNNNSGIVTTKSAGKVTKIVISWNAGTNAARELSIYGKNSAYSAATDLYGDDTAGDHLGDVACGTTEFTITGDYSFIGLRSKSGALYLNYVQIVWGDGGENAPTTPAPELAVTQTEVSVDAAAGSAYIDYTVANPTTGVTVSASSTANWISGFNYSTNGKVTFDVAENTSTEARSAVVTLAYEGAASKEVTVTQAGATPSGGDDTGSSVFI